jgi:hypothetical protein
MIKRWEIGLDSPIESGNDKYVVEIAEAGSASLAMTLLVYA